MNNAEKKAIYYDVKTVPSDFANHVSIKRGSENVHQFMKGNGTTGNHNSSPMPVTIKV